MPQVTSYKDICVALGQVRRDRVRIQNGIPLSALGPCLHLLGGSALRNSPFAPFVLLHRIIASNLYIGGFFGELDAGATQEENP
ncbi:uncharacterized protein F5147DRAFT_725266 [Suillus discolor]|uniref:Uncharacterized protein n=1 Tax=Suillus discolor TaxID=1912936 RepID=A0A9P7ETK8_9AGAM|nr:uncharacterized protein F5147DRAFT_725266 [Suillus discolor]KAG2090026.1 hypothetical protein F5147DRAFT_725266 [Suillus discolor]